MLYESCNFTYFQLLRFLLLNRKSYLVGVIVLSLSLLFFNEKEIPEKGNEPICPPGGKVQHACYYQAFAKNTFNNMMGNVILKKTSFLGRRDMKTPFWHANPLARKQHAAESILTSKSAY